MVQFVFIMILFDFLVRCTADPTYIINLNMVNGYITNLQETKPMLIKNQPFSFVIQSNTPLRYLQCRTELNILQVPSDNFGAMLINTYNEFYTLEKVMITTATMNGVWYCTIIHSQREPLSTQFMLIVKVRSQESILDDYSYYNNYNTKSNYQDNDSGSYFTQVGDTKNNSNSSEYQQYQVSTKNDETKTQADGQVKPSEQTENIIDEDTPKYNKSTLIIIIVTVVALLLLLLAVGFLARKKLYIRKSSADESESNRRMPLESVYEELDLKDTKNIENIRNRAPCPLPPEEREGNKKYIHYDTPYDHRFDRPLARQCRPSRNNAQAEKRL